MSTKKKMKPKILSVTVEETFIRVRTENDKQFGESKANDPENPGKEKTTKIENTRELEETAHEQPLPAFYEALGKLNAVAAKWLGCDPEWKEGVNVYGLSVSYNKRNTRTVQLVFTKEIAVIGSSQKMKTLGYQIDDDKEDGKRQCAKPHADLVDDFLKEAQRYAAGERSQTLLKFDEEDEAEDDKIENLPGIDTDGKPAT